MNAVVNDNAVIGESAIVAAMAFVKAGMIVAAAHAGRGNAGASGARAHRPGARVEDEGTLSYQELTRRCLGTMRATTPLTAPEANRPRINAEEMIPLHVFKEKQR